MPTRSLRAGGPRASGVPAGGVRAGGSDGPGGYPGGAPAFIGYLAAGWRLGDPGAFLAHFRPVLHPDVVIRQPLARPQTGIAGFERQFLANFALLPGMTAAIVNWAAAGPTVFAEFDVTAPGGHRPLRMPACDRFTLSGGLITERVTYFDPAAVLAFAARHPRRWPALLRGLFMLR
jgi:ketosteroid isomerase-like protein